MVSPTPMTIVNALVAAESVSLAQALPLCSRPYLSFPNIYLNLKSPSSLQHTVLSVITYLHEQHHRSSMTQPRSLNEFIYDSSGPHS